MNERNVFSVLNRQHEAIAAAELRAELVRQCFSMLPADMQAPLLSNEKKDGPLAGWISWSEPYEKPAGWAAGIFSALETVGWSLVPATYASYGQWRGSPKPGLVDEVPDEEKMNGTLRECEPIAPMWIEICQHIGAGVVCFMRAPDGRTYRVLVAVKHLAGLSVKFKPGQFGRPSKVVESVSLRHPDRWHSIETASGEVVAQRSHLSRAIIEDRQSGYVSGRIFWQACGEQSNWTMPAAEFVSFLTGGAS